MVGCLDVAVWNYRKALTEHLRLAVRLNPPSQRALTLSWRDQEELTDSARTIIGMEQVLGMTEDDIRTHGDSVCAEIGIRPLDTSLENEDM